MDVNTSKMINLDRLVCCNHGCVEDVVVFYGRLFVVTSLWQIGKFNLRSGNSVFSTLTYEPHYLTGKIRLVASKEQLFVVNLTATEFNVYRIDFSRSEWVKVEKLGDEALFIDNMSCRLSNTSKWGGRSNCVYYLSFNSGTCSVYSLNGEILETIQIGNCFFPAPISSWYFLDHLCSIESIDNVRDDD
ncbi:hypothetical protein Patl1_29790 [Pistacia atlantica]|uniref:Uncharacterized protein n=1 Tax=Pistacia atlantica TaxID=434234 RepID=A0ACC1AB85_9ROSI|nr:hypothetical protein Patl1_29790 [Pistacia atlantica]